MLMFAYLRIFAALSGLVIVAGAVLLGMAFRDIAEHDVTTLSERSNLALARGYQNTVWRQHRSVLEKLAALPVGEWRQYREFVEFAQASYQYFEGTQVTGVTLYTPRGAPFLQLNPQARDAAQSIRYDGATALDKDAEAAAVSGAPFTRLNILDDAGRAETLVPLLPQGFSPHLAAKPRLEGMAALSVDVTPQWEKLARFQWIATLGIIFIFGVLVAVLLFTALKAEAIISRQHEANLELTAAASTAQAENAAKSQFLANISHELRTPLNSIIGFSEIIKNEVMGQIDNPQYQEYVKDIHTSGVHLLSLINDILDFSKAEVGKLELDVNEVDVTKTILNCVRLVGPRAESAQVELVNELPKEHFVLSTDAKKLKQVMLNLLSNAIKFTAPGGRVHVLAWKHAGGDVISVEVRDTGIGIAPKDISRAMAPFGQVDNTLSRKYEGTGLGLPLTRKFVELMGGEFAIKSEVGAGTTITFTLPSLQKTGGAQAV